MPTPLVTPLPALDRTDPGFREDVDTFFASQVPTFTVQINMLADYLVGKSDAAAASETAAAESATAAADSATSAATQVTLATEQKTLAAAQATNAASSAASAATSAELAGAATGFDFTGGAGKYPQVNISETAFDLVDIPPPSIERSPRASNIELTSADSRTMVDFTSGTFTQALAAAASLGDGWYVYVKNSGTGVITLDPNGSEQIDGRATIRMYPGESFVIQSTGASLYSIGRQRVVELTAGTISGSTAQIDFEQGFDDDEINNIDIDFINTELASSGSPSLSGLVKIGGSYVATSYTSGSLVIDQSSGPTRLSGNNLTLINFGSITTSANRFSLSLSIIGKNVNSGVQIEHSMLNWETSVGASMNRAQGRSGNRNSGAVGGIRVSSAAGFLSGSYRSLGVR